MVAASVAMVIAKLIKKMPQIVQTIVFPLVLFNVTVRLAVIMVVVELADNAQWAMSALMVHVVLLRLISRLALIIIIPLILMALRSARLRVLVAVQPAARLIIYLKVVVGPLFKSSVLKSNPERMLLRLEELILEDHTV
jgi:hypothetical protein